MAVTVTSKDAERIARSFNDLIGKDGLRRIQRKAVNEEGAAIRKAARNIAPVLYGTAAANLKIQGKAASPGSDNPKYSLRMASGFPVGKLRSPLRKASKGGLTIRPPHQDTQHFRAVERVGRAFKLLPAGPLRERFLGAISTRARVAFADPDDGGLAELSALRRRAEKNLPATVAAQITDHLARMKGRRR